MNARLTSIAHGQGFGAAKKRGAELSLATSDDRPRYRPPAGNYDGAELRAHVRPGALAAFTLPSRVNNRLHHPDGRMTDLQGHPITNQP